MKNKMYHQYSLAKLLLEDGMPSMEELEAMQTRDRKKYGILTKKEEEDQETKRVFDLRDDEIKKLEKKILDSGGDKSLDFKRAFKTLGALGMNSKTLRNHYEELSKNSDFVQNGAMDVGQIVLQIDAFNKFVETLQATEGHVKVLEATKLPALCGAIAAAVSSMISLPVTLLVVLGWIGFFAGRLGVARDQADALGIGTDGGSGTSIFALWGFDEDVYRKFPEYASSSFFGRGDYKVNTAENVSKKSLSQKLKDAWEGEEIPATYERDEMGETKVAFKTRLMYISMEASEAGIDKKWTLAELQYEACLHFNGTKEAERWKDHKPQFGYIDWRSVNKELQGNVLERIRMGFDKWYGGLDDTLGRWGRNIIGYFGFGQGKKLDMTAADKQLAADQEKLEMLKLQKRAGEDPRKREEYLNKIAKKEKQFYAAYGKKLPKQGGLKKHMSGTWALGESIEEIVQRILSEGTTFENYDKLTPDENLELRMMEHSKDHVEDLENSVALAKAFQYYSETSISPLYRGVYNTETRILESLEIGDTFQFGRVTSLSVNEKIAKRFAKLGNMIELVPGADGCFNLAGLIVDRFDKWEAKNPTDFEMQDGPWRRDSALREAEWLLPMDTTYELLDISERDGLTVYKIKTV